VRYLKDPVIERWVLVAPGRELRPGAARPSRREGLAGDCPFCPGRESRTPPAVWTDPGSERAGWRVRVFANKYPALEGGHEVIVEHPDHDADLATLEHGDVVRVIAAYAARIEALYADGDIRYVQLFRNAGVAAGATQGHPHAQLLALPVVPPLVREELRGAAAVHAQQGACVYCELLRRSEDEGLVVHETRWHVALSPPAPRMPGETWILPRAHAATFRRDARIEDLAACVADVTRRVAGAFAEPAYTLLLHEAPRDGEDSPSYHWHFELLPRFNRYVRGRRKRFFIGFLVHRRVVPTFGQLSTEHSASDPVGGSVFWITRDRRVAVPG